MRGSNDALGDSIVLRCRERSNKHELRRAVGRMKTIREKHKILCGGGLSDRSY
jgi:hypothetical protein